MAIEKRPNGTLRVYWNNPFTGKREHVPAADMREAKKLDAQVKYRMKHERESFAHPDMPDPSAGVTVEQIVMAHLQAGTYTAQNLKHTFSHFNACNAEIGAVPVSELTAGHMKRLVKALRLRGLRQNGINRKIAIVQGALNWAVEEELIPTNPVYQFKCPRGEDRKIIPPTPAEVRKIIDAAPPHVHRAVVLSFHLGVRVGPSELFGIAWEHVDMERGVVHIRCAKKKGIVWREVGLRPDILALLSKWGDEDAWDGPLIRYSKDPGAKREDMKAVKSIKRAWASTLKAAKITRHMTPYSLRHAFATYVLSNGADIGAVAQVMGHSSTAMIHRHYQHVLTSQTKQVVDSVPGVLGTCLRDIQDDDSAPFCVPSGKRSLTNQ